MPAKRKKPEKQIRAEYQARVEKQQQDRRGLCSWLMFWKACGHKKCLREQACAAKANDCFDRLWPIVPERMKIGIRAAGKAAVARLPPAETKAAIMRDLTRWDDMMASQAAAQAVAEPAPQSLPIMPAPSPPAPSSCAPSAPAPSSCAPSPRAIGPRIRVL